MIGCVGQAGEQSGDAGSAGVARRRVPRPRAVGDHRAQVRIRPAGRRVRGRTAIIAGAYDIVVAGGVESMSRVPMGSARMGADPWGAGVAERFPGLVPQGVSAELVADKWGLCRVQLDEYAARSQRSGGRSRAVGRVRRRAARSVTVDGDARSTADETIRPDTTVERLAGLKAVFGTPEMADAVPRDRVEGDGGQLVADHRRSGRAAADERGEGGQAGAAAPSPDPRVERGRGRSDPDAHRSDPRHPQGAGPCRAVHRATSTRSR